MTFEEAKKHIETEVLEICNDIIDLYSELWDREADVFGHADYDETDSVILRDEKKQLYTERDELCKRVKALGELTQYYLRLFMRGN